MPISYVHRRDVALDGTAPALLYGYGSYEICIDPRFNARRVSVCSTEVSSTPSRTSAGVAKSGGDGTRTASSSINATRSPTSSRVLTTSSSSGSRAMRRLAIRGGSAGGLLMGAVVNLRPMSPRLWSPRCRSSIA